MKAITLLVFIFILMYAAACTILEGWALSILWAWFAPAFGTAWSMSAVQGIVILLIVRFVRPDNSPPRDMKNMKKAISEITKTPFRVAVTLGVAWVVRLFL